jgi:hypothetical protein
MRRHRNGNLETAMQSIDPTDAPCCEAVTFQNRAREVGYYAEEFVRPRETLFGRDQRRHQVQSRPVRRRFAAPAIAGFRNDA